MDTEFVTGGFAGTELLPLREILALVRRIYCGKIGAEFAHVSRARERLWLRERFETEAVTSRLSGEDKKKLLASLTAAEGLERYLHTRYVGQKRFSLEGGESLIPMLDDLIQKGGESGVEESGRAVHVEQMARRGGHRQAIGGRLAAGLPGFSKSAAAERLGRPAAGRVPQNRQRDHRGGREHHSQERDEPDLRGGHRGAVRRAAAVAA